jgi:5-formyltetrahydrofolate cyclo-ligase
MKPEYKALCDSRILARVTSLPEYKRAGTLLCFVSTAIEVDTRALIREALDDGKIVAVPYCVEGTRKMRFYRILSLEELAPRTFGVLEPDPMKAERITDFHDALCILPGIVFDRDGYRLGYGGGYYDRFLSRSFLGKGGVTCGICYSGCTIPYLHRGRYDMPSDILVTDQLIRRPSRRRG